MDKLKKNWPTVVSLFATAGAWLAVNRGWLTKEQISTAAVALGPIWTKLVHDMVAP